MVEIEEPPPLVNGKGQEEHIPLVHKLASLVAHAADARRSSDRSQQETCISQREAASRCLFPAQVVDWRQPTLATRRPPRVNYFSNFYQRNGLVRGVSIEEADEEFNLTTTTTHTDIDNDASMQIRIRQLIDSEVGR